MAQCPVKSIFAEGIPMPVNVAAQTQDPGPTRANAPPEWLPRIIDHVVANGMSDASMRRLAAVAGTSHRMLGYYYGTRDGVLGAVLHALRQEESVALIESAATRREAMEGAWGYFTAPERRLEMRIFFHLAGEAVQSPAEHLSFLAAVVSTWADGITRLGVREGVPEARATTEARLLTSAARGLLLDWMLTGDESEVQAAYARLLDAVLGPPGTAGRR